MGGKFDNAKAAFHPWTDNPEAVLRKARYAFVSRYLAILEAMQTKRLVVAVYNNQIKKDYLYCHPMKENMVIAGSDIELADQLNNLTPNQEKMKIEAAYQWARKQTWRKLVDTYYSLWN